jgi:hypothetical protein
VTPSVNGPKVTFDPEFPHKEMPRWWCGIEEIALGSDAQEGIAFGSTRDALGL